MTGSSKLDRSQLSVKHAHCGMEVHAQPEMSLNWSRDNGVSPANMRYGPNTGFMLDQRVRRWSNIKPVLRRRFWLNIKPAVDQRQLLIGSLYVSRDRRVDIGVSRSAGVVIAADTRTTG